MCAEGQRRKIHGGNVPAVPSSADIQSLAMKEAHNSDS